MKRSRLSRKSSKLHDKRLTPSGFTKTPTGWTLSSKTYKHGDRMLTDHLWEKRGIDEGIMVTMSEGAWLGTPEMCEGYIIQLKKFTPLAGGHRTNIQNIETRKAVTVESALKDAKELILIGDKGYSPKRQAKFVWETADKSWKWEATKYEGNGIFFGKVTSPFVPEGEWGTWYVWEVEQHAKLIEGDFELLVKIKEKSKKAQRMQQAMFG